MRQLDYQLSYKCADTGVFDISNTHTNALVPTPSLCMGTPDPRAESTHL